MAENVRVSTVISADPETIYEAWLDSAAHSAMTGAGATSDPRVGGAYSAWDGYITGRYLELEPSRRIVAAWRSSEFPAEAGDSTLEVLLQEVPEGTEVVLVHSEIPEGQAETYAQGWSSYYFEPMKRHFEVASQEDNALTIPAPRMPGAAAAVKVPKQARTPSAANAASKPTAAAPAKTAEKKTVKASAKKAVKKAAKKAAPARKAASKKTAKKAAKKTVNKPAKKAAKKVAKKVAKKAAKTTVNKPAKKAAKKVAKKAAKRAGKK